MNEVELKQRTKKFALRVMKLVDALPKSTAGRAIGNQLMRSGTSVGANYRAACRGRSKQEFIAKLGVVEEEKIRTYLRGEACQTIYLNFKNVINSTRVKLPFGIVQIGKAFRN